MVRTATRHGSLATLAGSRLVQKQTLDARLHVTDAQLVAETLAHRLYKPIVVWIATLTRPLRLANCRETRDTWHNTNVFRGGEWVLEQRFARALFTPDDDIQPVLALCLRLRPRQRHKRLAHGIVTLRECMLRNEIIVLLQFE